MGMRISNSIAVLAVAIACAACGTNPVTGKHEFQFVSQTEEIQMGEKSYAPSRQAEGGDMDVLPELTAYVSEVGQRLAKVADRQLPYEFKVLNNSVPNAWAMPGGKIAVNRGLLTELKNESELAAVLGHEIVHAAARHGAKAQERGTLMEAGLAVAQVGAAVGGVDPSLTQLAVQGGSVGLQAVQMKYGRDQELEADHYGMKYMKLAGYDPTGGVTLQETFVRMMNETGSKQGFFDHMFASHPPSTERVEKNKEMLATLGAGGEVGADTYQAHLAALIKAKPAYDKYDQASAALQKKDFASATKLANEASSLFPQEGRFAELRGEIELAQKHYKEAIPYYEKAKQLNPNYFGAYLGGGIAEYESGNKPKGQELITQSYNILPTQPAAYYLGKSAAARGDNAAALQLFKSAAGSNNTYGQLAAREYVSIDLREHPEQYLATGFEFDSAGRVVIVVQNRSPIALANIQLTPVLVDASGRPASTGNPVQVKRALEPNQQVVVSTGIAGVSAEQLQMLRVRVDGASVAER
jgi:predicted Zn-dependent protease